jgi:hypothetical protein
LSTLSPGIRNWAAVEALASELMEHKHLGKKQVREIIAKAQGDKKP